MRRAFCLAYSSVRMCSTRHDEIAASAIASRPVSSRWPMTSIRILSAVVCTYLSSAMSAKRLSSAPLGSRT